MQSSFMHDPLQWMPENWEIRQATDLVDKEMRGSGGTEIVIQTGIENGLYDPALLHSIDRFADEISTLVVGNMFVGKTSSVIDIIKESNRSLNENQESFYRIPDNRDLIAQELLLFENSGSDDLEDFVDTQFSQARFTLKGPWVDAGTHTELIAEVDKTLNEIIGDKAEFYITGMGSLFSRTMDAAIDSTKISYVIAAVVISIMMIILLGSLKLGLVSMAPNFLPIIIAMGAMGYLGAPFDMFTLLIGSIAIGLVVDDTIHFMHNFRRYYHRYGDVEKAIEETLMSTGRAIMVTTVVLCIGFFIFMAADMSNVFNFGLLTGSTIILALLADLLLAPALMVMIYGRNKENKGVSHAK
jgi:predicted RND superfamily exporter protein